jgi:hypothetical protein
MQFLVPGLHAISTGSLLASEIAGTPLGNTEALIMPPIKKRPATVERLVSLKPNPCSHPYRDLTIFSHRVSQIAVTRYNALRPVLALR